MVPTAPGYASFIDRPISLPAFNTRQVLAAVGSVVARNRQLEDMVRRMSVSDYLCGVCDIILEQGYCPFLFSDGWGCFQALMQLRCRLCPTCLVAGSFPDVACCTLSVLMQATAAGATPGGGAVPTHPSSPVLATSYSSQSLAAAAGPGQQNGLRPTSRLPPPPSS
jgi:hypothetical protein